MAGVAGGGLHGADAVAGAMQADGGHLDGGIRRQRRLDGLQRRVAGGVAEAVAVGLDDGCDVVGVVEGAGAGLERRFVEGPVGRPEAPEQPGDAAPVRFQPGPAELLVEVRG